MQTLPTIYPCKNKEDLAKQVIEVHKSIAEFYRSIPDEYFSGDAIPEGWTVRRNMKHVISTNGSFGFWIGLPKFIFKIWRKPSAKQPTIEQLEPTNRRGITYYGKYEKNQANKEEKEKLLELINASAAKVASQIQKRTEEELDQFAGVFGGMSLRTFCYFLMKHNVHHTNVVRLRLEN
ncbi:MAG TPA: DinB family protein [Leptospiraceae bacterium]|nr:DinB family protein [Leptospiraceae bacterium]HMW06546.1 DinB family protein [Leptospiraceae bacterium]HMX35244.1 DinB family protein [Leptospiraceae bacterium]HMY31264.1 DinB family protein [Leptospiraceae bacterium]HMZ67523.1 DinB family protein [Leptospiraceae bacterium]